METESISHRELDARLEAIEARIETRVQTTDHKIDRLIESNERLTQEVKGVHDEFKADRRNRWGAVLTTIFGTGAIVAAVVIFSQSSTQSWTQHFMTELKGEITRIERTVETLTKQAAAPSSTTQSTSPKAPPSPQKSP